MSSTIQEAAERLLARARMVSGRHGRITMWADGVEIVASFALEAANRQAALEEELEAATACADILVRIVRPMYAGPSGDQGLNDPLYGECQRAIARYKRSRATLAALAAVPAGDPPTEKGRGGCSFQL